MNAHDQPADEPPRLVEVLTTAATLCGFHGHESIEATHLLQALDILEGHLTMEDLGHGISPLVNRGSGSAPASPAVQALVQRWYQELGQDVRAPLQPAERERLRNELTELEGGVP